MKKSVFLALGLFFALFSLVSYSDTCPEPQTTSLKWGIPPSPWVENPYSPNKPQGEENSFFVRANILVAGLGRGVVCTYSIKAGEYSIWQQAPVKIPSRIDNNWIETLGGYMCTQGLTLCVFYIAHQSIDI